MSKIHEELLEAIVSSNQSMPFGNCSLRDGQLQGDVHIDPTQFMGTSIQRFCELAELSRFEDDVSLWFDTLDSAVVSGALLRLSFRDDGRCFAGFSYKFAIPYSERQLKIILDAALRGVGVVHEAAFEMNGDVGMWNGDIAVIDTELTVGQLMTCVDTAGLKVTINERDGELDSFGGVMHRLRAGRPEDILGMSEDATLEFKSFVDLDSKEGKIEFSQDVVRFANAESSAVIVVGIRTEKNGHRDVASRITPLPERFSNTDRYRKILDTRVYPPIRGLTIERFAVDSGSFLLAVIIPTQRLLDKPFLVHGHIVAGNVEGVFFSIVRRRGEDSIPITAREVHLLLSSGYRLLHHGADPRS